MRSLKTFRKAAASIIGEERAEYLALRTRTAADAKLEIAPIIAEVKAQSGTQSGTACEAGEGEIGNPRLLQSGRVAQLDRALPSGANQRGRIPCKKQGILVSVGSQKSEQKRAETHDNWNCASYDNLDRARRAWGALRLI